MSDFSRRTVVRGAAWTVPVVAVATQAPAFAVSPPPPPPPPVLSFAGACGNTGNQTKGCGGKFTLQVPLKVTNTLATPIVFQITGHYVRKDGVTPTGPGAGTQSGITAIYATPNFEMPGNVPGGQNDCTNVTASNCPGGIANGSIVVAPNTVGYYWIESLDTGSADDFTARIEYRLLDAASCAPLSGPFVAQTTTAISPANCNG